MANITNNSIGNVSGGNDLFSTSSTGSQSSSSAKAELNFVKKLTEEEILAKYKGQIKSEDLVQLKIKYPNLLTMSETEISSIINNYITTRTNDVTTTISKPEIAKNNGKTYQETTGTKFDFKSFKNVKEPQQKTNILKEEYTKNLYQTKWDEMTDTERETAKTQAIKNLVAKISKTKNDSETTALLNMLQNSEDIKNLKGEQRDKFNELLETVMTDIQTANLNNTTIDKFYEQDKDTKNEQKYKFLSDIIEADPSAINNFSRSDKLFYNNENAAIMAAKELLNNPEINIDNLSDKIKEYNNNHPNNKISRASLIYDYYSNKISKNETLDEDDQKIYDSYKSLKKYFGDLSKIPDFDSSNSMYLDMLKSTKYQDALKSAYVTEQKGEKAEQTAELEYLKSILGGNLTAEEFDNRYSKLLENCSITGAARLFKNVSLLQKNGDISISNNIVNNERAIAAGIEDVEDVDATVQDLLNSKNSEVNQNMSFWLSGLDKYAIEHGKADVSIKIRKSGKIETADIVKNRNYAASIGADAYIKEVETHFIKNPNEYSDQAAFNITEAGFKGLENWTEEEQTEHANSLGDIAKARHNAKISKAYAGIGHTAKGKAQIAVANKAMEISYTFDDETAKEIQKLFADDIQNYETNNQVQAHKIVSSSAYSEVQEYAASNIHNYDPSAQAGAIEATYATGNSAAISACEAQLSQCSGVNASESTYANYAQNQSTAQAINEAITSGDTQKLVELVENNNIEITNYLNSCSQKDKEVFVEKYCKAANESQLLAFLKSNTSMLDLVMRYANGKISKEKVFGAVYKGNKGEIKPLLAKLGIKGDEVINLAKTYKEYAPDIALATESSELAQSIVKNPEAWGYQMGRDETKDLQQIASQQNIAAATKKDTQPETAMTLRPSLDEIDSLQIFRNRNGFLSA